ncbi:plastocyanin/azurin family copper-binding protein [Rhodococcus sp. HNM0569]|uniref:cupredoxin domain-containing protein n=1 Tax=Rhodococcus sp. HNM0569 TaxID=2716340 RepID=UPI00146B42B9|nr:plastocyanin/azurin family copper-binding protein [Rhodococcus sp. HNM0569]NLU82627.1 copper-binding protein [Rhodococcus sp. HNM0569]
MKKLLALVVGLLAAVSLTACGGASDASSEPAVVIEVKDMAYSPAQVTIEKGQTVQWHFDDGGLPHDVVGEGALEGTLKSELLTEGTFEYTFDEAGTFDYHCTPHPMMVGTIVVE